MTETLVFVADVHLRPDCPWLAEFGEMLRGDEPYVYLLGDIIERHAGVKMVDLARVDPLTYNALVRAYDNARIITGNHDNDGVWMYSSSRVEFAPHKVAMHGHQFDHFCKDGLPDKITDILGKLAWKLDYHGMNRSSKLTRWIRSYGWQDRAFTYCQQNGIKLLITGHTHRAGIWTRGDITLATCGSWPDGDKRAVCVEGDKVWLT